MGLENADKNLIKRIESGLACEQCGRDLVDYHHSSDERGETDMEMLCPSCDFDGVVVIDCEHIEEETAGSA